MTTDRPPLLVDATPPLVGRAREQAMLRDALAAALAGRGSLVLIGGEAGIGKTVLAEALCRDADVHGALVLVGRCYDLAETPPYGPWRELLDRAPCDAGLPALPLALLAPERTGEVMAGQEAIVRRILGYLAALSATRSLVLLLEDLHWADPASLDLLRFLARNIADVPVLLLATYRSNEVAPNHPLGGLLPALVREARAVCLDLRPLDVTAIGALIALRYTLSATDHDRLVGYLVRRTEGNPLFLGELLRTLETSSVLSLDPRPTGIVGRDSWILGDLARVPVPTLLRQVIAGRLARLGDDDRRLLAVAAVLGQELLFDLWATVGEVEEAVLLATAERAITVRLLETTDTGVRFAHALIREALYDGVLAPRKRAWHRRAGEALVATNHPDPDTVADHFGRAGDVRAVGWLIRAGDRAERAYAWLTASTRFEAALALPTGALSPDEYGWVLLRLAVLRRNSDPQQVLALLAGVANAIAVSTDSLLGPYALLVTGLVRCYGGASAHGIAELATGVAQLAALPAEQRADLTRVPLCVRLALDDDGVGTLVLREAMAGHASAARARGERVIAVTPGRMAERPADPPRGDTYAGLATALAQLGQPAAAREAARWAVAEYRALGHHHLVASAHRGQLEIHWWYFAEVRADRASIIADLLEATTLASTALVLPAAHMNHTELLEGRWDELRPPHSATANVTWVAWSRRSQFRGEAARAWAVIKQFVPRGAATLPGDAFFSTVVELQQIAVALALESGDMSSAREWLEAHDRWLAWGEAVLWQAEGQALWARYHRQIGDLAQAHAFAKQALVHASDPRQPLALLVAHRLLGELSTATGHYPKAVTHLEVALALADACAVPYERALTLLALAELHWAMRCVTEVEQPLAAARTIFAQLGAAPALVRANALAAMLVPLVAPVTTYPVGLTAREVEVLRLIAAGCANLEIAARLSISSNTVMRHVTHILTKTGTDNRAAAAVFALRHGLDTPGDGR